MHIAWIGKKSPFCGNVTYGREVTNALLDRGYQVSFL
ncbi:MAG: glycosyltransferase family 4 protein, partial [Microcoleus sp. SIO2G3]|nr:glycosyltransferase family 4 protein [Microcoleus sp. SIO2G3]